MTKTKNRIFLSAGWHNLLLFNYSVPQQKLEKFLPPGVSLDIRDGSAHISLVAFQFLRTRVFGIKWPGFVDFPEVNLRFYIKLADERGVCFVREYVPSRLVSWIARTAYNEPYKRAAIADHVVTTSTTISAKYHLNDGESTMILSASALNRPYLPSEDSVEHFFKEHELGVGRDRSGRLVTYRVQHPQWLVYPIKDSSVQLDASGLYGPDFAFLAQQKPDSVLFASGSEVSVEMPAKTESPRL